jgi:hypothetical protein
VVARSFCQNAGALGAEVPFLDFGVWYFLGTYVGLKKAQRAVIRMRAGQVGASQRSPSIPLQCRLCRICGRDCVPHMHWGVDLCDGV